MIRPHCCCAAAGSAPEAIAAPELSGTAQVGARLVCLDGTYSGTEPITVGDYQWQRSADGSTGWADISAATAGDYTPALGDAGYYLRRGEVASNSVGDAARAYSDVSNSVAAADPLWSRDFSLATLGENATCTGTAGRTVVDHLGTSWSAISNEARFTGARRVRNLAPNSAFASTDGVTPDGWSGFGTTATRTCVNGVHTATGAWVRGHIGAAIATPSGAAQTRIFTGYIHTVNNQHDGGAIAACPTDSNEVIRSEMLDAAVNVGARIVFLKSDVSAGATHSSQGGMGALATSSHSLGWGSPQIEEYPTNYSAILPSEYVDSTVSHGAGANGVKYFPTANGNSIGANNLVVLASGTALTGITLANGADDNISWSGVPADNEARMVIDGSNVDVDDWDGDLDDAAYYGEISSITVYAPGERPT